MPHDATVQEVLTVLAGQVQDLTAWEAGFVANVRQQAAPLTAKQRAVLVELAEHYCDPLLAAELRGQQRLFGEGGKA